jgi:hypothetical protein
MGGGQLQIVTYGTQDIYLTGNPQVTHFKTVHRRHTNFAIESIMQPFNTSGGFGKIVSATLSKQGDLVHTMDLRVKLPAVPSNDSNKAFRWLNWIGHILVEYAEIEIGGQRIDRHYGHWLHIWNELTQTPGHQAGYARLNGNVPRLVQSTTGDIPEVVLYIPLQFWFNRNPGLAIPLIALQYHDIRINIKFADKEKCYWAEDNIRIPDELVAAELWVEYIYLDTEERTRFAQTPHEYLIEQVQFNGDQTYTGPQTAWNYRMAFNHPVKEVIWTAQKDSVVSSTLTSNYGGPQWFNYSDALDYTYFSGTPSDPLGGGIGTAAFGGASWPHNMPMSGNASVTSNIVAGFNDISLLNYNDLFGNTSAANSRAWTAKLPVFDSGENPIVKAKIQLNGQDRFMEREGLYFNTVQPLYRHSNCPAIGINLYSFALKPEDFQPSGSCNFTRIDIATLQFEFTQNMMLVNAAPDSVKLRVYAVNYNIFRIMSGMGGLAYNN